MPVDICVKIAIPATRDHLPRGDTLAPNRQCPLVAGTTVLSCLDTCPNHDSFLFFIICRTDCWGPAMLLMVCHTFVCPMVSVRHVKNVSKVLHSNCHGLRSVSAARIQISAFTAVGQIALYKALESLKLSCYGNGVGFPYQL